MRDRNLAVRRSCTILLILGALSSGASARPPQGASPPPAGAACADCHSDGIVERFASSPHGREFRHGVGGTCESCHGDAAAHIEAGDGSAIVHPGKLAAAEVEKVCLGCHAGNVAQAHWQGSAHQRRNVSCVDCHTVHDEPETASMVGVRQRTESCYRCHADVRAEMNKVSHHPVREGKMTCASCHDPHGSLFGKNLRAASVNELCYDCHTEKRGPFLWEHAPVRESCLHCHTPHGSNHIKLQSTSVPFLCQQCHLNTRHPGSLYDATRLPTLENPATGSNRLFNRACSDCHAAVHGSNNPSSPYLGN